MLLETPSLLITDDDPGFRETLRLIFEPKGFRTLLAGDGDEALKIVRNELVHVVLLDMHMPRLTGLETLRLLKEFRAMLPCILISAQLDELTIEQARRHTLTRCSRRPWPSVKSPARFGRRWNVLMRGTDDAGGEGWAVHRPLNRSWPKF